MSQYIDYYETLAQEDLDIGTALTTKRNPGGGTLAATQIGIHSFGLGQVATTSAWTPGTVPSGGSVSTTVTVNGAALGDFVLGSFSLSLAGLNISCYVSAANTITAVISNLTGAAVALGAGTLKILVLQSR